MHAQKRLADRELTDTRHAIACQQSRQRITACDDPLHLARIQAGGLSVDREHVDRCAPRGIGYRGSFEILGLLNTGVLPTEHRLRRLGIYNRNELDRDLIVAAHKHERAGIGKTHDCIIGADLPDGINRSLAADDLHIQIGVLVIALFDRDEEIGVAAVVAEVGDRRDTIHRPRTVRHQQESNKSECPAGNRTIVGPVHCATSLLNGWISIQARVLFGIQNHRVHTSQQWGTLIGRSHLGRASEP